MQLIPPADLAPPGIAHLSPEDRARLWARMVDEGDRLVFEGFLRRHGDFQTEAVDRAVPWPTGTDAREVRVVRPEDLVVITLQAGRIIDRADAAMLLRENRDEIDFERLHGEVVRQGLTAEYREIWAEAFPSEPLPRVD